MASNKKFNNPTIKWLTDYLKSEMPSSKEQAIYDTFGGRRNVNITGSDPNNLSFSLNNYNGYLRDGVDPKNNPIYMESFTPESLDALNANIAKQDALRNTDGGASVGQMARMLLGAAREHPLKTMGIGALGLGNVGGLMDNNKFGGQLGGLALGGIGSYMGNLNPGAAAMLTLGGGELGALFDKLRAKRESQRQQMPQQARR